MGKIRPNISPVNLILTLIIIISLFSLSFWSLLTLKERIDTAYVELRAEVVASGEMTAAEFDAASSDISNNAINWLMKSISDNFIFLLSIPVLGFILGSAIAMAGVYVLPKVAGFLVYLISALVALFGLVLAGLGVLSMNILLIPFGGVLALYAGYKLLFDRTGLKKVSYMLSASAKVIKEEKEVLIPPLVFFVISIFVNLALLAFVLVDPTIGGQSIFGFQYGQEVKSLLVVALGTFTHTFFYFSLMSIVVGITYVWYRKRDPDMKLGISIALSRLNTIFYFSVIQTLIKVIDRALQMASGKARSGKGKQNMGMQAGAAIAGGLRRLIGLAWGIVNYFTLQTITIDGLGARDSIKRSAKVLKDSIPDAMLKEVFANPAMSFINAMLFLILLSGNIIISMVLSLDIFRAVLMFCGLLFFGYIPIAITMQTLGVNYNTILYGYCRDRVFRKNRAARIPAFMKKELERAKTKAGRKERYRGITGKLLKFLETNQRIEKFLYTKDSKNSLDNFIK